MNVRSSSGPVINKCHLVAVHCVGVELSLCGHLGYREMLRKHFCVGVGRFILILEDICVWFSLNAIYYSVGERCDLFLFEYLALYHGATVEASATVCKVRVVWWTELAAGVGWLLFASFSNSALIKVYQRKAHNTLKTVCDKWLWLFTAAGKTQKSLLLA